MKKFIVYLILAGVLIFASVAFAVPTSTLFSTLSVITQTIVSSTNATFTNATSTNFRFTNATSSGNLQISTLTITSTTRPESDIVYSTSSIGPILRATDGVCFRLSVATSGALSTTSSTCP